MRQLLCNTLSNSTDRRTARRIPMPKVHNNGTLGCTALHALVLGNIELLCCQRRKNFNSLQGCSCSTQTTIMYVHAACNTPRIFPLRLFLSSIFIGDQKSENGVPSLPFPPLPRPALLCLCPSLIMPTEGQRDAHLPLY